MMKKKTIPLKVSIIGNFISNSFRNSKIRITAITTNDATVDIAAAYSPNILIKIIFIHIFVNAPYIEVANAPLVLPVDK